MILNRVLQKFDRSAAHLKLALHPIRAGLCRCQARARPRSAWHTSVCPPPWPPRPLRWTLDGTRAAPSTSGGRGSLP